MRNKIIDLNNALFAELESLQDEFLYTDDNGVIDKDKVEIAIKRANTVSDIASKIIDLQKLQLDAYKFSVNEGLNVMLPETLGFEKKTNEPIY